MLKGGKSSCEHFSVFHRSPTSQTIADCIKRPLSEMMDTKAHAFKKKDDLNLF